MSGDSAVMEGVPEALSAANLVNAVAVKLPLFWPDNIETWFVQSESQFRFKGVVVSQTKFDYCVQSMMQEVAVKVLNIIRNPPAEDSYRHLKDRLLRMFVLNDYSCAEAILNLPLSGEMQPSTLMSRMLSLLPTSHEPSFFLRAAFLKCLPVDVRAYLHDRNSDPLTLALHADEIFQNRVSFASAVNHVSSTPVLGNEFLLRSALPLLVLPCPPVSLLPFSPLLSVSLSFQMFSLQIGSQPLNLTIKFATTS